MNINEEKISAQIEGRYTLNFKFSGLSEKETVDIYEQKGLFFIQPVFKNAKQISREKFERIVSMSVGFKADTEERFFDAETDLTFGDFMDEYYNLKEGMALGQYIYKYFGDSQRAFAVEQGVAPAQVTQWLNKGFIVVDDELYSPRRKLKRAI